ncbi:hypothetical protein LCGC14_0485120 [marine sediment metagenome]|uniref:DNA primase/polymerase bifunctional N-terminal domain-containing protein n=1 Tax=marine sediment metagenome TaxID=412755 RepID=A0A0F9SDM2_9ZZZZ
MTDIPLQLQQPQYRFIVLKSKSKTPIQKWTQTTNHYRYDNPYIKRHITEGGNVALILGTKDGTSYGNIIAIDFDNEEVQQKCLPKLPKTFTIKSGGKGLLHLYYKTDKTRILRITKEINGENERLVDVQGPGTIIVCPPSTHPSGKQYTVHDNSPINFIEMKQVKETLLPFHTSKLKAEQKYKTSQKTQKAKTGLLKNITDLGLTIKQIMQDLGMNINKNPTECIFHNSKGKASFSWDNSKGIYHCFGCGEKGNELTLLRKLNGK